MNVLLCVPERITRKLGAPKVYVELSEALEEKGCSCELVGVEDVAPNISQYDGKEGKITHYSQQLREYISRRTGEFDVVEFEHKHLPFPHSSLPENVLLVARSVLLGHHARSIRLPIWEGVSGILQNTLEHLMERGRKRTDVQLKDYLTTLKKHVGTAVRYELNRTKRQRQAERTTETCRAADLVIASNSHDRRTLEEKGIDPQKIKILPFGLSDERYEALSPSAWTVPDPPTFVFIGTHDFRKGGATDIPRIAYRLLAEFSSARIRLLGTRGLFANEEEVLAHFRPDVQGRVEVVPVYSPGNLPELLQDGTIGLFPSYYEGFGFGVLEMLASGLPVVAYNVPGPPEMLPDDLLVPSGDWKQLADKAKRLVMSDSLEECRRMANTRAHGFQWSNIAEQTIEAYRGRTGI